MSNFLWTPAVDMIVPILNVSFLMHRDDSGLCQAHRVGIPEFSIIQFVKDNVDGKGVFLDCGAHMGVYSIYLSENFEHVYAFEPQQRTYLQLCGNLFLNEVTNVHPLNLAVSDGQGDAQQKLYIVSEDGGGSTLNRPTDDVEILSEETVNTCMIDQLEFDQEVSLIKLDIEGNELKALNGAIKTILKYRPAVIFENNTGRANYKKQQEIYSFFAEIGYTVTAFKNFDNMFIACDKELG